MDLLDYIHVHVEKPWYNYHFILGNLKILTIVLLMLHYDLTPTKSNS